jgi:starch synthase
VKILFVAAEMAPLVKVGGLADVIGSLPKALNQLGHDVRVMIPRYGMLDLSQHRVAPVLDKLDVVVGRLSRQISVELAENEIKVYLVNGEDFRTAKEPYGEGELQRFLVYCRAVVEVLHEMEWQPEIVHCHDWHTALVPFWLRSEGGKGKYVTFFTIHNLAYQGAFDSAFLAQCGLEGSWRSPFAEMAQPPLNFMGQGILWADVVTTVSETYAREILTPEYGAGLHILLRYRQNRLFGIVNGLDYEMYDPLTDRYLAANYDANSLEKRKVNKMVLQNEVGLSQDSEVALIGMVSRLDEQKGLDIVVESFPSLFYKPDIQMVILGKGKEYYHSLLRRAAERYRHRLGVAITFDERLARLIYGGCDMFLMPSRFEPCGLGQLIAMRYGAVPVVRHTGGLAETVENLAEDLSRGTGFVFQTYSSGDLLAAIERAVSVYKNKQVWQRIVRSIMGRDFSWQASAQKYESLYHRALEGRL